MIYERKEENMYVKAMKVLYMMKYENEEKYGRMKSNMN